jgi:hypothetical protein
VTLVTLTAPATTGTGIPSTEESMRFQTALPALAMIGLIGTAQAEDYSFTVNNNAGSKIVRIQVSEDGRHWGDFDIGSGIPAGASVELI